MQEESGVRRQIHRYILENFLFTDDDEALDDEASFLEEGVVDSTGILELVMFVEETFGIAVQDEELLPENFDSVVQLTRYVLGKLAEGDGGTDDAASLSGGE